jgi:DNA-binding protein YbaB
MWGSELPDLSGLRALQREADELAGRLAAAAGAAEAEFTAGDDAGVVDVTIGADGAASRVRLDPGWRRVVGVDGLGSSVVAALTAATTERLSAWAGAMASGNTAAVADRGPDRRTEVGDPSSRRSVLAVRDLMDLINEVTARLHEVARTAGAVPVPDVTSTNGSRTVRVTATGGMVTAVDFDGQWLRSVDHLRIAAAVQEALAASVHDAARARQERFDAVPGLDRVRRLTASPETLLREIGLLR